MGPQMSNTSWDVYREIHKAMRFALFGVTARAGATAADDDAGVAALLREWDDVCLVLLGHHGHEDDFCDALIETHAPQLRGELEESHLMADGVIARLRASAGRIAASPSGDRWSLLRSFYLDLADFTGQYIDHLRFEEDVVMPALNAAMSNEELEAVTNMIRGSVPPPEMCVFIRYMVPSMNFSERLDMLGGMHAGAPPDVFEMFRAAAQAALPSNEYRAVAEAAGFV